MHARSPLAICFAISIFGATLLYADDEPMCQTGAILPSAELAPTLDPSLPPFPETDDGGAASLAFKSVAVLGFVLALAYLILNKGLGRFIKRKDTGSSIVIKERHALDQKKSLYVIVVENRTLLVAGTEQHVSLLADLTNDQKISFSGQLAEDPGPPSIEYSRPYFSHKIM